MKIQKIKARQILDSRGNPTLEADVILENGILGRAAVPSGASTGTNEALELRDGDPKNYFGKSVLKAVNNVSQIIAEKLIGFEVTEQEKIDQAMIDLDGTENKSKLGANAILAVSLASAKAAAQSLNKPLYEYFNSLTLDKPNMVLPLPMMNIINGGAHANFATDIQEFMILPVGAQSFSEGLQIGVTVFQSLKKILEKDGYPTTVGDEGGFAPILKGGNIQALNYIAQAVKTAGYNLGQDVVLALDVAASEFYDDGTYHLKSDRLDLKTAEMIQYLAKYLADFPIVSIEDGLAENDWDGWINLTKELGDKIQIVGDDLLVTNTKFIQKAIDQKAANAVLVKLNQIGTLTETIKAVEMAKKAGWSAIISHRSGETEDTTIAHLAVGLGTGQIKTGSLSRVDRTAKYNELLRIEEVFGKEKFSQNPFK